MGSPGGQGSPEAPETSRSGRKTPAAGKKEELSVSKRQIRAACARVTRAKWENDQQKKLKNEMT